MWNAPGGLFVTRTSKTVSRKFYSLHELTLEESFRGNDFSAFRFHVYYYLYILYGSNNSVREIEIFGFEFAPITFTKKNRSQSLQSWYMRVRKLETCSFGAVVRCFHKQMPPSIYFSVSKFVLFPRKFAPTVLPFGTFRNNVKSRAAFVYCTATPSVFSLQINVDLSLTLYSNPALRISL